MKKPNIPKQRAGFEFVLFFLVMICFASSVHADDVIIIHLNYKVVLNPANGNRPPGVTDALIRQAVTEMNALLATYWRGYSMQLDAITDIGGVGNNGPSRFYNRNFFDDNNGHRWKNAMEDSAKNIDPAGYAWVTNAINIYITNGIGGGICSFLSDGEEIIIIGRATAAGNGALQLHEIGHYFNLCHTQGCECGDCSTCADPESDEVQDSINDRQCWNLDDIANANFNVSYASLAPSQREQVDNVAQNVMSYHHQAPLFNHLTRMTEGQLDRWAAAADVFDARRAVRDGRTWFVGTPTMFTNGRGTSYDPYRFVSQAVNSANTAGSDIIMLKPGAYVGSSTSNGITITKSVTFRATRAGFAVIGTAILSPGTTLVESPEKVLAKLKKEAPGLFVNRADSRLGFPGTESK